VRRLTLSFSDLLLLVGAAILVFCSGMVMQRWLALSSAGSSPYTDVLWSYWQLHVARRSEAQWLSSVFGAFGLPLSFTSHEELAVLGSSASLLLGAAAKWKCSSSSIPAILA